MKTLKMPVMGLLVAGLLGGCQAVQTASPLTQNDVRTSAVAFAAGLRQGDEKLVRQVAVTDNTPDARQLGEQVLKETLSARAVQLGLSKEFEYVETKPGVVGGEAWVTRMEANARGAEIVRDGDRVRVGPENTDGTIYLRQVDGVWKVEIVPTLVAEAGGKTMVTDPAIEYRFGVTRAINVWMLERMKEGEFHSKGEYESARNRFWMQYLTYVSSGKDPSERLLTTLPPMPSDGGTASVR